jgi:hypothetical protein
MSKKHHGGPAPVPPGNQPKLGWDANEAETAQNQNPPAGEGFHEQDPKRRLGGYGTAGEHPIQQPSALNDGGSASRTG